MALHWSRSQPLCCSTDLLSWLCGSSPRNRHREENAPHGPTTRSNYSWRSYWRHIPSTSRLSSISESWTRPRDALATSYPTNATRRNHLSTICSGVFHKNHKKIKNTFFSIFFLLEGNFDIDAGDGGGWGGDHLEHKFPQITKHQTPGTFFKKCQKVYLKYLHIYRNSHRIR